MSEETSLIVLKQKPIIEFSAMESRGLEVAERIGQMNLDTIEATESNRSLMKKMRAELNKELDVFESQRKMIHSSITKPYKAFTDSYEQNIKVRYVEAVALLKSNISLVETEMLETKKSDLSAYFEGQKGELYFIALDDLCLNIILSVTDKKLRKQVDDFIARVESDVVSINAMSDSIRIESLYKTNLDFSLSVSTVLADIKREKELEERRIASEIAAKAAQEKRAKQEQEDKEKAAKERVERKKREAVELERKRDEAEKNAALNKSKEAAQALERIEQENKRAAEDLILAEKESQRINEEKEERSKAEAAEKAVHTMKFKVSGTIKQLKEIKQFMNNLGVSYE